MGNSNNLIGSDEIIQSNPNNNLKTSKPMSEEFMDWIQKNCKQLILKKHTPSPTGKKANSGLQGVW